VQTSVQATVQPPPKQDALYDQAPGVVPLMQLALVMFPAVQDCSETKPKQPAVGGPSPPHAALLKVPFAAPLLVVLFEQV
jgi:hypothetical protein